MAKNVSSNVLDAALSYLCDNGAQMNINATEPANYAEATAGAKFLDSVALTVGAGNGDYSALAAGDTNGRKVTIAAQNFASIETSGTADHISIVKTSATTDLLLVTTLASSQAVTAGNSADTTAFDYEINIPT